MLEQIKSIVTNSEVDNSLFKKNNINNSDDFSAFLKSASLLNKVKAIHSFLVSSLDFEPYKELLKNEYTPILLLIKELNMSRSSDPQVLQELYNNVLKAYDTICGNIKVNA